MFKQNVNRKTLMKTTWEVFVNFECATYGRGEGGGGERQQAELWQGMAREVCRDFF